MKKGFFSFLPPDPLSGRVWDLPAAPSAEDPPAWELMAEIHCCMSSPSLHWNKYSPPLDSLRKLIRSKISPVKKLHDEPKDNLLESKDVLFLGVIGSDFGSGAGDFNRRFALVGGIRAGAVRLGILVETDLSALQDDAHPIPRPAIRCCNG